MKIRFLLLSTLFPVLILTTGMVHAKSSGPVTGNFTEDGLRLTLKTSEISLVITTLEIYSCNGTKETFYPMPYVILRDGDPWVYFTTIPMERVNVISTNPDFSYVDNPVPRLITTFTRNCHVTETPPELVCKNVSLPHTLHRKDAETISFKTNHPIVSAGIRLPGVNGLVWVETIIWNHRLRREPNLKYDDQANQWSGNFPSMNIPVGDYKDVWLLVFDEFGQQASCKIGKLSILP